MRIYQPVRGVGAALRENSFMIIDDAGVEIGQGGLEYRILRKMFEERPLDIEMTLNAHPAAIDTLYGALIARAERIKAENDNLPARLYTRCSIQDAARYNYFINMGFDDKDGVELFVLYVQENMTQRQNYPPIGTKCEDADLHTRARREEFLQRLKSLGDEPHAEEWLSDQMRSPVFAAKVVMYGSEFVGAVLVTGNQQEAVVQMIGVEPKWRGKGVGSALIDEVQLQLSGQKIPYLVVRTQRRNQRMLRMLKRCRFEWIRTEELLLGRDI
jgi:GNAT superfamily N-acetyltransferase